MNRSLVRDIDRMSDRSIGSFVSLASLSALVYHHTINALALPIKLVLPTTDIAENYRPTTNTQSKKPSSKELLSRGAGRIDRFALNETFIRH